MTILTALQAVNSSLRAPMSFVYADLNEANFTVDQIANASLPVLIILPFTTKDTPGKSGILKTTFELTAFVLTKKTDQNTTDYSAATLETEVIAPMRLKARQFMHKLNEHAIIDPETSGIQQINIQPTYSSMDANLHGVVITATVPVMEVLTGCEP